MKSISKVSDKPQKSFVKPLVYTAAGLAAVLLVGIRFDIYSPSSVKDLMMGLSNSFFVPGFLMICFGLLSWMAHLGAYDAFSFSFSFIKQRFRKEDKVQSYYDFKQDKASKRLPWSATFLIIGASFSAVAGIFYLIWAKL